MINNDDMRRRTDQVRDELDNVVSKINLPFGRVVFTVNGGVLAKYCPKVDKVMLTKTDVTSSAEPRWLNMPTNLATPSLSAYMRFLVGDFGKVRLIVKNRRVVEIHWSAKFRLGTRGEPPAQAL